MIRQFIYKLTLLASLLICGSGISQISISSLNTAYTENFSMGSSSTATLPTGFKIGTDWSSGTSATTRSGGTSGTGILNNSSAGGVYNFANGVTATSTERALGFLNSGSFSSPRSIVFSFTNNTGSTITALNINFDYEKYRSGSRAFDWTFFHGSTTNPSTAATAGDQSYAADANNNVVSNPPLSISKTVSLTGLSIADGSTYYLKWTFTGVGGSSNGQAIGIDNFSITASGAAQSNLNTNPSSLTGLNYTEGSGPSAGNSYTLTGTNLTSSVTVTAPANFDISESSSFSDVSTNNGVLTISPSSGSISTTIYARLKAGLSANTYTGNISHTGNDLTSAVNVSVSGTVAPGITITKISAIQGSGSTAALTGVRTIEGIVTRTFLGTTKLNGFYVQEEETDYDSNPATSEGIFVFDRNGLFTGNQGDKVRITGTVAEFTSSTSSLTQLSGLTSVNVISTGNSLPTVINVQLPVSNVSDLERYEGMLVNMSASSGNLTVTEYFQLGRFGQVVLSANGSSNQAGTDARLDQYTQFNLPSVSGYSAYLADIAKRKIYLDDGSSNQNLDPIIFGRGGNPLSASNTLRGGDQVASITAVLDERFEGYRLQTSSGVNFIAANPRPTTPPSVGGALKVGSANLLNYFNGPSFPTSRGADNITEFNRQRAKITKALVESGLDVIGVNEMENDGFDASSAIQDLVNGLNDLAGAGTYSFINPNTSISSDEITVGIIYKTSKVQPIGAAATIPNAYGNGAFDVVGRKPLAQTFLDINAGGHFTFVINHFKSKGSSSGGAGDSDSGDGQGNSNGTRTRQSQDLLSWLATNPTGATDGDYLIAGDLNAYAKEDPIRTLENGGFIALLPNTSYSYVFDGQVGSLDHALATSSLKNQVTGAEKWHINADEPEALDYNTEFKITNLINSLYSPDQFRVSDHDPVIVGLNIVDDVAPTVSCVGNQQKENDLNQCSYTVVGTEFDPTTSNDNKGVVSTTFKLTGATNRTGSNTLSGVFFNVGTTTVTWTVKDAANNQASCSFDVVVTDAQLPTITCPSNVTVNTNLNACVATNVALGTPSVGDNCGVAMGYPTNNKPSSYSLGTTNVVWTVVDVNNNSNTCVQTVNIEKVFAGTTVTVIPSTQQYSDLVTLSASVTTCNDAGDVGGIVTFKIGTQTMGTAEVQPDGTATLSDVALLETVTGQMAPTNSRTVTAIFSGYNTSKYVLNNTAPTTTIKITQEDAIVTYTGSPFFSTSSATSSTVSVNLTATIQDIDDANRGDIKNATAKFLVDGVEYAGTITYVNSADKTVATVVSSTPVTFNIGNSSGQTFTVSVIVGGYYTGSNSVTVNVAKPLNDFVTGGGHIILENSVGLKAGDAGTRNNFGFNVKYNKSNKNLQGNVNVIFRRTESDGLHTYQVKGNVMSSLSVNPTSELTGSAFYNGKASLSDITNPLSPVSLGGNAIVNMEIIDNGEPGTNDAIAITVWNSSNALWFSSKWNGTTTVTQNLAGGNLSVRGGAYGFVNSDLSERNEPTKDALNSNNLTVELAPNPVSDIVNLQLNGWENDGTVKVYLTDMLMRTHQVWQISLDNGQASMNLNIVNQPAGAYLINIQGENTKRIMTKKIVKTGN